jgi:hypothetical protein
LSQRCLAYTLCLLSRKNCVCCHRLNYLQVSGCSG